MKQTVFVWSDYWPEYEARLLWMGSPAYLMFAACNADQLTLVPKE